MGGDNSGQLTLWNGEVGGAEDGHEAYRSAPVTVGGEMGVTGILEASPFREGR